MILDITAIKNYRDLRNLQQLSMGLNMEKVILLLDGTTDTTSPQFISALISLGIYNFAKNVEGIQYLYNTPNTYRDVAQYHILGANPLLSGQPAGANVSNVNNTNSSFGPAINMNQNNSFNANMGVKTEFSSMMTPGARIIGIKGLTKHAGATTLIYILKKALETKFNVCAIEVDANDFQLFNDKNLFSVSSNEIEKTIQDNNRRDIILIDVNNNETALEFCNEVIYLIEPSIIKINKMLAVNPTIFQKIKDKKIILNQSLLNVSDVGQFENEARIKTFYNMPPLNERIRANENIKEFLGKLGFNI
jgi:hypothetical protein